MLAAVRGMIWSYLNAPSNDRITQMSKRTSTSRVLGKTLPGTLWGAELNSVHCPSTLVHLGYPHTCLLQTTNTSELISSRQVFKSLTFSTGIPSITPAAVYHSECSSASAPEGSRDCSRKNKCVVLHCRNYRPLPTSCYHMNGFPGREEGRGKEGGQECGCL